jgi:hypothetical protein
MVAYVTIERGKGSGYSPSIEVKTFLEEEGDVYLAYSSTHVDHKAWMVELGVSFHATPHMEWSL